MLPTHVVNLHGSKDEVVIRQIICEAESYLWIGEPFTSTGIIVRTACFHIRNSEFFQQGVFMCSFDSQNKQQVPFSAASTDQSL
jgi:hypothetical protein